LALDLISNVCSCKVYVAVVHFPPEASSFCVEDAMLQALQGMTKTLDRFLSSVDPALLHASDRARLLEAATRVEQRAASLKTLLAKRAADSGEWAQRGHRSPEDWLAKQTGTSYGQAAGTLNASEKLLELPELEGAVRAGELSQPQLNELAAAARPDNEKQLVDAAVGARIEAALGAETDNIFKAARAEGRNEPLSAYHLDALVNLVCGGGAKVDTTVVVRVDESRLRAEGGLCEAVATGAVPVSEAIGAILAGAFVKVVAHDGVDITRVFHHGRHIPETLRTAIFERDGYTCVRPRCGAATRLEVHHWRVPHAKGGPMAYWNAASVCPHDHDLLTHGGHRLEGGPGNWTWIAPP
jgi:hypothetical protein